MSGAILSKRGRKIALTVLGVLALGTLALGITGARNAFGANFGWGLIQIVVAVIALLIISLGAFLVNEVAER